MPPLLQTADDFSTRIAEVKRGLAPAHFEWYPYDSFGNFEHLRTLLHDDANELVELAGGDTVLDLGCGDGSVTFFLESLGCRVHAIDYAATNYNRMQGIHELKRVFGSPARIEEMNLDSQFQLEGQYGLAFALGLLYHLKNPVYFLDQLSRHARYLILSTRVARYTPDRSVRIQDLPVGYLVDADETNADATNYWIFSEAGLRRLFKRTNWCLWGMVMAGESSQSDPASGEGDERAYCLAQSRLFPMGVRLLDGWYAPEEAGWRWTARKFSVSHPQVQAGEEVKLHFALPESLLNRVGTVTLTCSAAGVRLPECTYSTAGEHVYRAPLPESCEALQIDFEVSKVLPPSGGDERELGIIVLSVA